MVGEVDIGDEAAIAVEIAVAGNQHADLRTDLPNEVGAEAVIDVDFFGAEGGAEGFPGTGADDEKRILIGARHAAEHQAGHHRQPAQKLLGLEHKGIPNPPKSGAMIG